MAQFNDDGATARLNNLHKQEEERLIQALAPQYGFEYVDLNALTINPEALKAVDEKTARAAMIMPFEMHRDVLSVAFRNPNNQKTQEVLTSLQSRYQLSLYMCSTLSLEHGWERYSDIKTTEVQKKGVLDIHPDDILRFQKKIKSPDDVVELIKNVRSANNAKRVSETLEVMFAGSFSLGASDIHIEPEQNAIRLRYRLDGVLIDVIDLEHSIYERLLSRLKLLSGMILNKKNEAQDGRFTLDLVERSIEIRSSVIPGSQGESIVMRLLDPSVAGFSLEKIGLNTRMQEVMTEQLKKPNGLIITTGPTGSGKTTALYAFLRSVHNPGIKIITIENPVEYKIEDIVQTQTGDDYTFASGLRAILRQDPDVIMVGEIRDHEVAETAIHAAQTGHLVFSTLHTNSAVASFPRLIDLGIDARFIGSSVNVIIGQRLVRKLCNACKAPKVPTPEESRTVYRLVKSHPGNIVAPEPLVLYEAVGCTICNKTGFKGRMGVFEAVVMDDAVEEAVIRDPREHVIEEAAAPQKIPTMAEHGIEKVIAGETSLTELQRVVDIGINNQDTLPVETPPSDDTFQSHIV